MKSLKSLISSAPLIAGLILGGGLQALAAPASEPYRDPSVALDQRVADLVSRMTLPEKISQLSHLSPGIPRLGVIAYDPDLFNPLNPAGNMFIPNPAEFSEKRPWENLQYWKKGECLDSGYGNEALHGVARSGLATVFPQAIGLGSTWNPGLIKKVATVISDEAQAHNRIYGKKLVYWSPTINMLRDPRWGRVEEAYSEDPYLQARMAVAFVQGMQGDDPFYLKAVATVKHFAGNSSEFNRHTGSCTVPERQLREYYFPAFQAAVQEGRVQSLMGAYNAVNGLPSCANPWLLTDVLRKEWGFDGFVVSDCGAISDLVHTHKLETDPEKAVARAVAAGCDLECETCEIEQFLYDKYLPGAVAKGYLDEATIDRAVSRIFRIRFRLGEFDPRERYPYSHIGWDHLDTTANRNLSLQASRESIVLMKNAGGLLPLDASKVRTVAVIGPNGDVAELGGYSGTPPFKITPVAGLREKLGVGRVLHEVGCNATTPISNGVARAVAAATKADVAIVVLGVNQQIANEGRDRKDLELPAVQAELMEKVVAANPRTVLVLMSGPPLAINWAKEHVSAIVNVWFPGQSGGRALTEVLFGDYNPAGRLPITFYKSASDLPPLDDYDITKGRTYWHFKGDPLYPFGHGLSYSTFEYCNLRVSKEFAAVQDGKLAVAFDLKNTCARNGDEVVQLYVRDVASAYPQAMKKLRKFDRVPTRAGQTVKVRFTLTREDFQFWNPDRRGWEVEPGEFEILVGSSSQDIRLCGKLTVR